MARKLELDLVAKSNADVVLNRVRKAADNFGAGLVSRLTGAFGAMALFDKALSFTTETFREFGGLADQIAKSGLDSGQFQQLAYAAKQSGADVKDVTKAVRELNTAISEAKLDPKSQKSRALLALGFSPEQIAAGTIKATDVFIQLSKAMEQATSDAEKTAIATVLLGDKVGQNLIPMLENGKASLDKLFKDAPIVNDAALKSIDEANDRIDSFQAKVKGLLALNFGDLLSGNLVSMSQAFTATGTGLNLGKILSPATTPAGEGLGKPDAKALIESQAKATAEATSSLGSGVIGVGASPQIAAMMEQTDVLKEINSGIGQLVKQSTDTDFTKSLARKFNQPPR
jgi:hypothetical protein